MNRRNCMAISPYWQGDLDGLCGIYSVINAARLIMPNLSEDDSTKMFAKILRHLEPKKKLSYIFVQGLLDKDLNEIFKQVMKNSYGILASRPFQNRQKRPRLDEFIEAIRIFLEEQAKRAIIISVDSDDWEHWSVVKKITRNEIHFFDSSEMCKFRLKRCTTGKPTKAQPYFLNPRQTFFLEKR